MTPFGAGQPIRKVDVEKRKARFERWAGMAAQPPIAGTLGNRLDDRNRAGFRMPAMAGPSARTGGRPESAEARNRGMQGATAAATYRQAMGIV